MITKEQMLTNIIELHKILIDEFGGSHGVRDNILLESAVYSVYQTFGGEEKYKTAEEKAARLCYALIKNHAFYDGNKRIGILMLNLFCEYHNINLNVSDNELVELGIDIATNKLEYEDILKILRNHIK